MACAVSGSAAFAGDKPLTGPVPSWVAPEPATAVKALSGGNAPPLFDEQIMVDGGTVTTYVDVAELISSPEKLISAGTFTTNWQPGHGDLTLHRIEIWRGGKVIDALQGGEGITVLRREAGLEKLVVDGQLTAVKHIEGLQVGDVLRMSFSQSEADPVLAGQVQGALFLLPAPMKLGFGRARLVWPTARSIDWKALMPGISAVPRPVDAKWTALDLPLPVAKLPDMPKNMPTRFQPLPLLMFSSFPSWAEVGKAMAPLYSTRDAIAPSSELAAKVDAIAAQTTDPEQRIAAALRLVQDDVRYQLIALGTGNYVPQTVAETWSKRYGDCKAKSLLLLAVLDRLGIKAEAVLANTERGDAVAQGLPAPMAFNHVFVRAHVGDQEYWLDGTALGSRLADIYDVPRFGYVLPLTGAAPALVDLPRRAHARPDLDIALQYDMAAGPHLPAPFHLTLRYAGMFAASNRVESGPDYAEKLTTFAEKAAKTWTNSDTIAAPRASYDAEQAVWTLSIDGVAYPDWQFRDGRYGLALPPELKVVLDAPRDRAAWRAIPALIDQPWTANSRVTIKLPDNGVNVAIGGSQDASLDLPAARWRRTVRRNGDQLVEEIASGESGAEIAAQDVSTAGKTITEATARTARVELEPAYPQRWADVGRMQGTAPVRATRAIFDQRIANKPDDATRLSDRAWLEERLLDYTSAEVDYGKAIALDGSANRYLSRAQLRAKRGDHPGALKDLLAAQDLEQGNTDVRNNLAVELAEAGRIDEGLDLLPADPDITTDDGLSDFLLRVDVLERGGRHADAIALLDGALEKRGNTAELRNARCWFNALSGDDLDGALADCDRAIELSADPAGYLDSRAMVHFRAGRLDKARADYEAALALEPEMASALFMSGIVLGRLGEKGAGTANEDAARKLYPDIDHFYQHFGIKP